MQIPTAHLGVCYHPVLNQLPAGLTTEGLLGKRYAAHIIDCVFASFLVSLGEELSRTFSGSFAESEGGVFFQLGQLVFLWVAYFALFESSAWQATPGKHWLGLKVYDGAGKRLTLGRAFLRAVVRDVPWFCIITLGLIVGTLLNSLLLIAHLQAIHFSKFNLAIHDRVAKTWVAAPEATTQFHLNI